MWNFLLGLLIGGLILTWVAYYLVAGHWAIWSELSPHQIGVIEGMVLMLLVTVLGDLIKERKE